MSSPDSSPLAFDQLLSYLRQRGFIIGVDHYLRLQELLTKIGGDCSPHELKTLLCPIFATNKIQQEQFYRVFDEYFSLFQQAPSKESGPLGSKGDEITSYRQEDTAKASSKKLFYILGAIFLVVLVFYFSMSRKGALPTARSNANGQDLTFGSDKSLKGEGSNQQETEEQAAKTEKDPEKELSFYRRYQFAFRITAVAIPLIAFLFYELYRFNKRKLILQKQKGRKPPFVWPIRVGASRAKLFVSDRFYEATRLMRRRQADEFYTLDVNETITATVGALGYPHFKYKLASKPPEYLVLIERASPRDHQAQFFNRMMKEIEREAIFVTRYFYDGDPRVCCNEKGDRCLHLSDLQNKFTSHRLLIFGKGEKLIDPITGRLAPWASMFAQWQDRAILTPENPSQWGIREIALARQFVLLPATSDGLNALIDNFESSLRSVAQYDWMREGPETPDLDELSISEAVPALRHYLGEDTFQWVCACAIYPELHWDLTIYLGSLSCVGENLVREENLAKIAGLTWFRTGSMPDDLRWHLINELDRKREKGVREALIKLLEENPPPAETFAADSYELNLVVQRWLSVRDRKRRREMLRLMKEQPPNRILQDYTLLQFLESAPKSSLAVTLPKKFRKLFYQNGIPAFGFKTSARLVITLAAAAVVWIAMLSSQSNKSPLQNITKKLEELSSSGAEAESIAIPGGTFQMGRSDGLLQEGPPRNVTVKPFSMDKTEVTNAEYAQFVKETGYPAPSHFVDGKPVVGQENWPVVNVSIEDAKKFAEWRSKRDGVQYRLPTEEEWEYAARNGDQNTLYPWGSSWEANRAWTKEAAPASVKPVGSMPDGKNRWGVLDLIGNVWEWTDSKASYYPGSKGQLDPAHRDWYIIRGGSIGSESKGDTPISSTFRNWIKPTEKDYRLGFRLVRGNQ